MRKSLLAAGAVALALGSGIAAAAPSGTHGAKASSASAISRELSTLQQRAAAAGNTRLVHALAATRVAVARSDAADGPRGASPSPICPSQSPNGGNNPPCGIDHNGILPICPSHSPNSGNSPPCGNGGGQGPGGGSGGGGGGGGGTAACGPADQGGSAATGPVSGVLYQVGEGISQNGGAPLGDAVQQIACAVFTNLGL